MHKITLPIFESEEVKEIKKTPNKTNLTSSMSVDELLQSPEIFKKYIKKHKLDIDWSILIRDYELSDEFVLFFLDKIIKSGNIAGISKLKCIPLQIIEENWSNLKRCSSIIVANNANITVDFLINIKSEIKLGNIIKNKNISDKLIADFIKESETDYLFAIGFFELYDEDYERLKRVIKIAYPNMDDFLDKILINYYFKCCYCGEE